MKREDELGCFEQLCFMLTVLNKSCFTAVRTWLSVCIVALSVGYSSGLLVNEARYSSIVTMMEYQSATRRPLLVLTISWSNISVSTSVLNSTACRHVLDPDPC